MNDSSFEGVTVIEMQPFTGETDDTIKLILGYLHYQERKQLFNFLVNKGKKKKRGEKLK